jgi:PII-like signaling protein
VLLGVDGVHNGQRQRAGLLSRNVNVPMATIAVGPTHALRRVLQALPDVLARPVANLERIAVVKHDGDLLEPLPLITDSGDGDPPVWMALRVYTRQSAQANGGAIYTTLTRRLRRAGAAGVTTLRGEWGVLQRRAALRRPLRHPRKPRSDLHRLRRPPQDDR